MPSSNWWRLVVGPMSKTVLAQFPILDPDLFITWWGTDPIFVITPIMDKRKCEHKQTWGFSSYIAFLSALLHYTNIETFRMLIRTRFPLFTNQ
jgi:hypothetical protein